MGDRITPQRSNPNLRYGAPRYSKHTASYATRPATYMNDSSDTTLHKSPDVKGNNPVWNTIRSASPQNIGIAYISPDKDAKARFSVDSYLDPQVIKKSSAYGDTKGRFCTGMRSTSFAREIKSKVKLNNPKNINSLQTRIDELEVDKLRSDSRIAELTEELNSMKIIYQKVDERSRQKDEQIDDLILENMRLRKATNGFDELQRMVLDQEHASTAYYEKMCEEFQSFVDSTIKLDKSLRGIAYEVRSSVRNTTYKTGGGAMLQGMRLICEQLQILLENERTHNSLRQHSRAGNVIVEHNGEYPLQKKPSESSNTPLQKAVRTPLSATANTRPSETKVNYGIAEKTVYMSVITRDKDAELMKKIARYKLNKITKELTTAPTVQSRPAKTAGKKKSSKRLNISVSSYPLGGL